LPLLKLVAQPLGAAVQVLLVVVKGPGVHVVPTHE
jgi:hypothetical protein